MQNTVFVMKKILSTQTQFWISSIADGKLSMGQKNVKALVEREGELSIVIEAAIAAGIHLVQLTDEHGIEFIAASKYPYKILC